MKFFTATTLSIAIVARLSLADSSDTSLQVGPNCLVSDVIQAASNQTGVTSSSDSSTASETDGYNFINYCAGKTLTNGTQNTAGSCNPIPMGHIPSTSQMASCIITFPTAGAELSENTSFNISVQTANLAVGSFSNAATNYFSAPQDLDASGIVVGHVHVTVQDIGALDTTTPPDASKYVFFKGINDKGNGQGLLQARVTDGLPAGVYRVCTLVSSTNHQPVVMPVALRGSQDDCTKFTVVKKANGDDCPTLVTVTVTATETVTTTFKASGST